MKTKTRSTTTTAQKPKRRRRGGIDTVTTFLFVAIVAILVLWVVFGVVMPRVTDGVKEVFREHGERDVVAYEAVVQGCKIWWKTGHLLDTTMPDGLPLDFDNARLNEPITDPTPQVRDEGIAYCNRAKVEARPTVQKSIRDMQAAGASQDEIEAYIQREVLLECIDKCTAMLDLHSSCGESLDVPSSDCYRGDRFTMTVRADRTKKQNVRCVVEGC